MKLHNPVWPRWLRCLRDNATFAALGPARYPLQGLNFSALWLSDELGTPGYGVDDSVPAACCFLFVQSKELVLTKPLDNYKRANRIIQEAPDGKPGWDFERLAHTMHRLRPDWLEPCVNFRCEDPVCARAVGYVKELTPVTHGVPMLLTRGLVHDWQHRACGVSALARSEVQTLASVRETVDVPCPASMASLEEVYEMKGCPQNRVRSDAMKAVTFNYAAGISALIHRRTPLSQRIQNKTRSAKVAVFSLKKGMCTALVRCWSLCCAECARRPWCEAWQWNLTSTQCSLSIDQPVRARTPSFGRVVGCSSCDLSAYAM